MEEKIQEKNKYLTQKSRLIILIFYVISILLVSKLVTGHFFPPDSGKRLWILSGLALWFFTLLTAPWFRPPRDSLTNAITAILLLAFLDFQNVDLLREELNHFRWIAVGFSSFTALAAIVSIISHNITHENNNSQKTITNLSYSISDSFGKGEIIFTFPALISIIGFFQNSLSQQLWLLLFWVSFTVVRPFDLIGKLFLEIISRKKTENEVTYIGTINRVDNPDIIRVSLTSESSWIPGNLAIACLPNGKQVNVLCLFSHVQESQLVGTGLCHGITKDPIPNAIESYVYQCKTDIDSNCIINELSGTDNDVDLVGFVVEGSSISTIKFEVSPNVSLEKGMLTFCRQNNETVYYQILDAKTTEESFEKNPRGKHVVDAVQLGCLDPEKGFVKYGWLPKMNSPVFVPKKPVKYDFNYTNKDDFNIGNIPGTNIVVRASFSDLHEFHSAILGVTGTGKTEMAFDIIKKALSLDTKVFCVDFTDEYIERLKDFNPRPLGLEKKMATEFEEKLFDVETGEYGAPKEKKALKEFVDRIKEPVKENVNSFLTSEEKSLGIFWLPEITNTRATLRATELYLSSIMEWARKNRRKRKVLVVLEEAHTIIPETAGSGFDKETQWVVGRISQIALQGRKYGVGLLLISQRTALVSKSILSQCNTYFTFSLVDETSLKYLTNVYSINYVQSIPNLKFLEAIASGKAIRSETPLIIELEYDEEKKKASNTLNKYKS